MKPAMQIVIAGRDKDDLARVAQLAGGRSSGVQTRLIVNGHSDPLHGLEALPEVLVYCASGTWREELTALSERPTRPLTIVVAHDMDPAMMRLAMRAGAREFLSAPVDTAELVSILEALESEQRASAAPARGRIVAVVGAKGGVGTSTVAANLAYALARQRRKALLVDLDIQTGELGNLFDLPPHDGLREALRRVDTIDEVAFGGYVARHDSGVSLLTSVITTPGSWELPAERLDALLRLAAKSYELVVLDVPRRIDDAIGAALVAADEVLLVLQQSVAHLRGAKRVTELFASLGLDRNRLTAVINRYGRHVDISTDDIKEALRARSVFTLPNDFSLVAQAADLGSPVLQTAPTSSLGRRMTDLARQLAGDDAPVVPTGAIGRLFSKLSKR